MHLVFGEWTTALDAVYNKEIFSLILFSFFILLFSHPTSKVPAGGPIDRPLFAPCAFRCTYRPTYMYRPIMHYVGYPYAYAGSFYFVGQLSMAHAKHNRQTGRMLFKEYPYYSAAKEFCRNCKYEVIYYNNKNWILECSERLYYNFHSEKCLLKPVA